APRTRRLAAAQQRTSPPPGRREGQVMEIRIGVQHSPREIVLESEEKSDALIERLSGAIADGSPVTLVDDKGRTVLVPGAKVAYVEVSTEEPRRVGFLG